MGFYFSYPRWYRKAAEQGYADAQYNVGFIYQNGDVVEENDFARR